MSKKTSFRITLLAAVLILASAFYYLPYYVTKPGMAKELSPIIKVDGGYEEEGSFMLTTVRMGRANIYSYLVAKYSKYQEIFPVEAIRQENETDEDYTNRQLHMMDSSKTNAIEVAYKKAGLPVNYDYKGVYVLQVVPGMPADGKLVAGDHILKLDGKKFVSSSDFIEYVSSKKAGENVTLSIKRKSKPRDVTLPLKQFDKTSERAGIGIVPVDDKKIKVNPKVTVNSEEIGGPSAGLMFTLEIYNQLNKEDITKGYEIAGTGTISSDGTIGPIGGIEQKIIAADKAHADLFFAPNENGAKGSNFRAAVKTAKDIGTGMKIIPVDTFDDALKYLEKLKEKTS
ncbi:SepM family pheromone-processing serine protease [Mesobacillus zeae]|uniref:endopeptidase La n=1 Tax=Mesobacillus zeae TaxID=1917180 RepID=A0A398BCI6_9BACI|nr:SepM family pheromone-processing serine protease [Mesobacillus zeae]RID87889.1 PDZ domain-containing protein [Mesobacillus zeae]